MPVCVGGIHPINVTFLTVTAKDIEDDTEVLLAVHVSEQGEGTSSAKLVLIKR